MKLKELNDTIAATCNVRVNVVASIQNEMFKQLRAALEKEDKITIPEFGIFSVREVPGEDGQPAKRKIRFRLKSAEKKAGRKAKKGESVPEAESGEADED